MKEERNEGRKGEDRNGSESMGKLKRKGKGKDGAQKEHGYGMKGRCGYPSRKVEVYP